MWQISNHEEEIKKLQRREVVASIRKTSLWCNVLAPQMSKTLSSAKNKITQSMREQFNCKFYEVSCDMVFNNILIILIVYIISL